MNQFISSAVGEKLAALMTEEFLARAERGTRKAYDRVLRRVPAGDPSARPGMRRKATRAKKTRR